MVQAVAGGTTRSSRPLSSSIPAAARSFSTPIPAPIASTSTLSSKTSTAGPSQRPAMNGLPRRSFSEGRPELDRNETSRTTTAAAAGSRPSPNTQQPIPSPFLPEHLRPHEFILPAINSSSIGGPNVDILNHPDHRSPFEAKHAGPGCLRRVFIGPHRADAARVSGSGGAALLSTPGLYDARPRPHGKARAYTDEHDGSSSSFSSGDEFFDDEDARSEAKRLRKEERAKWKKRFISGIERDHPTMKGKERRNGKRIPTGEMIRGGTLKPSGSRKSSTHQWVGGSFEIGGDVRAAAKRREENRANASRSASAAVVGNGAASTVQTGASKTFVTARTHPDTTMTTTNALQPSLAVEETLPPQIAHALLRRTSDEGPTETASLSAVPAPESELTDLGTSTASRPDTKSILKRSQAHASLGHGHPSMNGQAQNGSEAPDEFGRPKSTRSMPLPPPAIRTESTAKIRFSQPLLDRAAGPGDEPPRPVEEVLTRPDVAEQESVQATIDELRAKPPKKPGKNDVLRQERMLVRVEWTAREDLPNDFDENTARKFPTSGETWEEYGVVWRPGRIELWNEYALSATSFFLGHKKLAHVIPLAPARTKLSLYSSADVIFCLTHRPNGSGLLGGATSHIVGKKEEEATPSASKATRNRYIHRRHGTYVFIFRTRAMSVAKEWMWLLYRGLGKTLPDHLEITVPGIGAKIRMPIPSILQESAEGSGKGIHARQAGTYLIDEETKLLLRQFQPHLIVEACLEQLKRVNEWQSVLADRDPKDIKLCWKRGHVLDWVDVYGKRDVDWSLLCGFSLRQPHLEPALELRAALHYPTTVRVPATPKAPPHRLAEPPAIEGYVARLRKNSLASERIYLSSHDGHLFVCSPSTCHPPDPPAPPTAFTLNPAIMVLAPFALGWSSVVAGSEKKRERILERVSRSVSGVSGASSANERRKRERALQTLFAENADDEKFLDEGDWVAKMELSERQRAVQQILEARGYVDLRDVARVGTIDDADSCKGDEYGTASNDLGGEEGMVQALDRVLLAKRRTFVIETKKGVKALFECYSIAVRDEWIGRLNALVTYWTRRERVDAMDQMELHPSSPSRQAEVIARLRDKIKNQNEAAGFVNRTPFLHPGGTRPLGVTRSEGDATLLNKAFNWCILQGCRSIIFCGKFYVKRGLRGLFKERHLVLLPGTLIEYQAHDRDFHGQITASSYHYRKSVLSLRDCYVYSGRLTYPLMAISVGNPTGSWDPGDIQHRLPRVYTGTDGLRVNDEEEDCTLVIFKRATSGRNTSFGKKGTSYVLRARSRIERDECVFALNAAIEKLRHAEKSREKRMKDFAWLETMKKKKDK
ncbi:BQ2448_3614 [Microbotryum intermedium]|uniref:BQ2448_3614 protein n=1 Tax=Microbotryum intermedium TaxID=269621 RepID=A0A238FAH7_9BASI|nr:BQ2448_3614 [Microbotryum intermedium]